MCSCEGEDRIRMGVWCVVVHREACGVMIVAGGVGVGKLHCLGCDTSGLHAPVTDGGGIFREVGIMRTRLDPVFGRRFLG
jgi:hypothetical protein